MEYEYRKTKVICSEVKEIGPKEAAEMLEKNIDNRKVKPSKVQQYALYMKNDLWRENGETILVTEDGFLLNGQHRLQAIIASGTTQAFLIVTVVPVDGKGRLTPLGIIQDRGSVRRHHDITGVPPFCDAISATMIREFMINGRTHSQNTMLRAAIYDVFNEEMDWLFKRCNIAKRALSRATIRTAFVLRHSQGYDFSDQYHVILTDLVGLPKSWMNWYERVSNIASNNGASRDQLLSLTWALTEPGRDDSKPIVMSGNKIKDCLSEMKEQFHYYAGETIHKVIHDYRYVA